MEEFINNAADWLELHGVELAIGVLASWIATRLSSRFDVPLRTELDRLRRHLARRSGLSLSCYVGSDPQDQVIFVFQRIRTADRLLGRFVRAKSSLGREYVVFLTVAYVILGIMVLPLFLQVLPPWPVVLSILVVSLLLSFILCIYRPERAATFLLLFPLSFFFLPTVLRGSRVVYDRFQLAEACRWHLLLAIPSTNSARAVLKRKDEHLAHLLKATELVESANLGEDAFESLVVIHDHLRNAIDVMERWPDTCSGLLSLQIPELTYPSGGAATSDEKREA